MPKTFLKFTLVIIAAIALVACTPKPPSKEVVAESIKKIIPVSFEVVSVAPMKEISGLVQVVLSVGKQPVVFYMDMNGKYVISGSVVELATKKNLTAEVLNSLSGAHKESSAPAAAPPAKAQ